MTVSVDCWECINPLWPSDAKVIGSGNGLLFVVACCSMPCHYLNQCWLVVNWIPRNTHCGYMNRNKTIFIHENAFQNVVCKMSAILFSSLNGLRSLTVTVDIIDGWVQERRNSTANALELHLSCTNPSKYDTSDPVHLNTRIYPHSIIFLAN